MIEQVIEGTWEEVSSHAEMLAGRRVRVMVLQEDEEHHDPASTNGEASEPQTLAEAFAGLIGGFHFGDAHLSENTGEKFADLLVEKHRQGHL